VVGCQRSPQKRRTILSIFDEIFWRNVFLHRPTAL
jgi:hypothetical protein